MKIDTGDYVLCSDRLGNFHIKEKRFNEETQKVTEVRVSGYFKYASSAVKDMIKRKVYSSDVCSIVDLSVEVDKLINMLNDLTEKLCKELDDRSYCKVSDDEDD